MSFYDRRDRRRSVTAATVFAMDVGNLNFSPPEKKKKKKKKREEGKEREREKKKGKKKKKNIWLDFFLLNFWGDCIVFLFGLLVRLLYTKFFFLFKFSLFFGLAWLFS